MIYVRLRASEREGEHGAPSDTYPYYPCTRTNTKFDYYFRYIRFLFI